MRGNCFGAVAVAAVLVCVASPSLAEDAGRKAFTEHCQKCHSVSSEGLEHTTTVASMQGADL